jgi:hypothetical protein
MGNIALYPQIYPIYNHTKNIIVKGDNPKSKYYANNYLRELIAIDKIDMNYHNWLPIGTNYTSIVKTTNNGVVCEVYEIKPFFIKTNLSIKAHLCNHHIIHNNCYILLSETQQELFGLIESKSEDKNTNELSWDNETENMSDENRQQYINELVEDIDNLISSEYEVLK